MLMKQFLACIAIATEVQNRKIRMKNAKFASKIKSQTEF